jgi:predicted PurR-regulated permease PerM
MDLLVLILILLSGYIIKYLIDTINSLNNEIKEIKMKCISNNKNDIKFEIPSLKNPADNINDTLIKNIVYFKNFFDE